MDEAKKQLLISNLKIINDHSKTMKNVIEKHEGVREKASRYIYQLVTLASVMAGFGFTAISFTKVIELFICGELLLFSSMVVAMLFVKKAFLNEARLYASYVDKLNDAMNDRMQISLDGSAAEIKVAMDNVARKDLRVFDEKSPDINSELFLNLAFYSFIFGGITLLGSFIN